ncbi:MAG: sigma-70 family RNA polymerase sigma factor [Myxococcota bacterium]|nr:sigma-70 family RNA polymerase sigma factor [Myxococcota bacterium]
MQTGDTTPHAPPAWAELSTRLRPFVRRRVDSDVDADDVLQDVLLKAHRSLGDLRDDDRLEAWLYRVARTSIADHLRARQRHPLTRREAPEAAHEPFAEDDDAVAREVALYVRLFVPLLPEPYREAIELVELEGLTHREAAERLGISVSGMKSRVQRGRAKLRQLLEACCEIALDARGKPVSCEPRGGDCC